MQSNIRQKKSAGFTLIEVMMVIVLLGFMASVVQYTISGNSPEDRLEKTSERFISVFNIASDFALLNNMELGLAVGENTYQFFVFDGLEWKSIPDNELLGEYTLPEGMLTSIELDDLPIEEPELIDTLIEVMNDDDTLFEGTDIGRDEDTDFKESDEEGDDEEKQVAKKVSKKDKKKIMPQVFILSGGEISPFRIEFYFDEFFVPTDDLSYQVTGLYATPLTLSGPLYGGAPR